MIALKKGPGGRYTTDQWVISELTSDEARGTFNYRCRYLGEAEWTEGEEKYDEMLRGVGCGSETKMMLSARLDMIIDGLKANQTVLLSRELQIVILRDDKDNLVYCVGPPSGPILRRVATGRPMVSNDLIQDVLDATIEAAALQEAALFGGEPIVEEVDEPVPDALHTEILCVGCGESKLQCPNCNASYMEGPDACPACGTAANMPQIAAMAAPVCPPAVTKEHDPSKVTLITHDEDGGVVKTEMPVPPEFQDLNTPVGHGGLPSHIQEDPLTGNITGQEPPQPAPPMTTKPMSSKVAITPDASATIHRLMAALATPLNAHAISAAVLNLCELHKIDPAEFVEDLRGTLARCAKVWGTNKG